MKTHSFSNSIIQPSNIAQRESLPSSSPEESTHKVDLFFHPYEGSEEEIKNYKIVVVVDVLRSGTSIPIALSNDAREIIPVADISHATELASQLERDYLLLCGEREGRMISGFHLGNSPSEYHRDRVRGKTLIFATTNATPALVRWSYAQTVYLCGLVNLPAVVQMVIKHLELFPLAVVCAGRDGRFALEDAVCGGVLIKEIENALTDQLYLNDAARAARLLAKEYGGDLYELLRMCDYGQYLITIGMEQDLNICASLGVLPVVPVMSDLKLIKG
ncbi:MAG: 2-phosphosulfolactate phosphatase [bacterium]